MCKPVMAFDVTYNKKFTVLNEKDYRKYVDNRVKSKFEDVFGEVLEQIEDGRCKDGKKPYNNYAVINLDEPYIDEIIGIMKQNGH